MISVYIVSSYMNICLFESKFQILQYSIPIFVIYRGITEEMIFAAIVTETFIVTCKPFHIHGIVAHL